MQIQRWITLPGEIGSENPVLPRYPHRWRSSAHRGKNRQKTWNIGYPLPPLVIVINSEISGFFGKTTNLSGFLKTRNLRGFLRFFDTKNVTDEILDEKPPIHKVNQSLKWVSTIGFFGKTMNLSVFFWKTRNLKGFLPFFDTKNATDEILDEKPPIHKVNQSLKWVSAIGFLEKR